MWENAEEKMTYGTVNEMRVANNCMELRNSAISITLLTESFVIVAHLHDFTMMSVCALLGFL